jgi:hypothetical protein
MFLGHYQLGSLLPLCVWCRTHAGVPTEPDAAPCAHIFAEDGSVAYAATLPILDRQRITGYFHDRLNLDGRFSTQRYSILYNYTIATNPLVDQAEFEVVAGGDARGSGISMQLVRQHAADYVLLQSHAGQLERLKNPEVRNR